MDWDDSLSQVFPVLQLPKTGGLPEPEFTLTDSFVTTIRKPMAPGKTPRQDQATGQVGEQVGEQVRAILKAVEGKAATKQDLLKAAGLSNAYLNYKRHILPALAQKLIERTIPDKPNSPTSSSLNNPKQSP